MRLRRTWREVVSGLSQTLRRVAVLAALAILAVIPAHALPSCDLLRKCSGELAIAYQKSGFPLRVVRQYRRNSVAPFERGEAVQPGLCRKVLAIIINNAVEMRRRGRLKYVPPSCTHKKLRNLGQPR